MVRPIGPRASPSVRQMLEERKRAHLKHRASGRSWEQMGWDAPIWLAVLTEEVGEVARALCDGSDRSHLRAELIQVAAMATAWADAITFFRGDGTAVSP